MLLVGSLYRIHSNNCALGRYLGGNLFQCLKIQNGNIVAKKSTMSRAFHEHDKTVPILWTVAPKTQRRYIAGEPVILMDRGVYTLQPIGCIFKSYSNNDTCHVDYHGNRPINLSTIRTVNYLICDANCRRAVLCWLLVARELCSKDIRCLIGQLVWESRDEREWEERNSAPKRAKIK